MKIELTEEEQREMMVALAHWRAYLISQDRDDSTVKSVLDRLRPPGEPEETPKRPSVH